VNINYKTGYYEEVKPNYRDFDEYLPEFWKMKYEDRWQIISDLQDVEFFKKRKVLDIGCGLGRALKYFQGYGAECLGVEPSEYAAGIAKSRGLEVINDYFQNTEIDDLFDVIHIEQVLSHDPMYKEALVKARDLLKPNGILVIEEPNDNNILQKLLRNEKGEYWITPDHCNYFNYELLAKTLLEAKFKPVKTSCTFPMEFFELMGDKYIGNEEKGKEVHLKRFQLESSLPFSMRQNLHESMARLGLGRDCVIFAKGVL
jgi:SAM-dependent methyltransferase